MLRGVCHLQTPIAAVALGILLCMPVGGSANQIRWLSYRANDGLVSEKILAVSRERNGILWFGAEAGLIRFDGEQFNSFSTGNGLPHPRIQCLYLGPNNELWIGTPKGLALFKNSRFTWPGKTNELERSNVTAIFRDSKNLIWVGTTGGIIKYNGQRFEEIFKSGLIVAIFENPSGTLWFVERTDLIKYENGVFRRLELAPDSILSAAAGPNQTIWLGTVSGPLQLKNNRLLPAASPAALRGRRINSVLQDKLGEVWFAAEDGLYEYNLNYESPLLTKHAWPEGETNLTVNTIIDAEDGSLWLGTDQGVFCYHANPFQLLTDENFEGAAATHAIFQDRDGNLWIGTDKGAYIYDGSRFVAAFQADSLQAAGIHTIHQSANGNYWLGTGRNGLIRKQGSAIDLMRREQGLSNNIVRSVLEDRRGNLWIGTFKGLNQYDGRSFQQYNTANGLPSNVIFALYERANGEFWIGTDAGACRFDGEKFENFKFPGPAFIVRAFYEDRQKRFWLGTWDGLRLLRGQNFETLGEGAEFAHLDITAITDDLDGNLWAATRKNGVVKYDQRGFTKFDMARRFPSDSVLFAMRDRDGMLWFGTTKGLVQYDYKPPQWRRFNHSLINQNNAARFSFEAEDGRFGAQSEDLRYSYRFASAGKEAEANWSPFLRKKEIAFSSLERGLYALQVRSTDTRGNSDTTAVKTFVMESLDKESPRLALRKAPPDTIRIGEEQRVTATFEYIGEDNLTPEKNLLYKIRLLPVERNWKETRENTVAYANLPRGNYTFEVKAVDTDGFLSMESAVKNFVITGTQPPAILFTAQFPDTIRTQELTFRYRGLDDRTPSNQLVYSHRLLGLASTWSEFRPDTAAAFGNLRSGTYTFQIRAKDAEGQVTASPAEMTMVIDLKENPLIRLARTVAAKINETEAAFSFIGADAKTATANLLYSYRILPRDEAWSVWIPDTMQVYRELDRGMNYTFQVKARDENEYESQPVESAFYVRQFWEVGLYQIWAAVSVAGMLLLGFAAAHVIGKRRYQQAAIAGYNPYIIGRPVIEPQEFFGREKEIKRVMAGLPNSSFIITGERRIGKTSFQKQLGQRLAAANHPGYEFYPVFIDLQGVEEARFYDHLVHELKEQISKLLQLGLTMDFIPEQSDHYDSVGVNNILRTTVARLAEQSDKQARLVLQLDEFDQFNQYELDTKLQFRSFFMRDYGKQLRAVLTGFRIEEEKDADLSPWWNIFEKIKFSALEREAATTLILRPVGNIYKYEPAAVEKIIDLSRGKPFIIQRFCSLLVDHIIQQKRRTIVEADVHIVSQEALFKDDLKPGQEFAVNPYITRNWVAGENFYGRTQMVNKIFDANNKFVWILGTRRSGKTSLLHHTADLIKKSPAKFSYAPFFWDMSVAGTRPGLASSFEQSLADQQAFLRARGLNVDQILQSENIFDRLRALHNCCQQQNLTLLLLCDETESLINLLEADPQAVTDLRLFLAGAETLKTVMVSSLALYKLEASAAGREFLDRFWPEEYLPNLSAREARDLILQKQNENLRDHFLPPSEEEADQIIQKTGGNPFLVQWACALWLEKQDLQAAYDEMAAGELRSFFEIDYNTLGDHEKKIFDFLKDGIRSASWIRRQIPDFEKHLLRLEKLYLAKRAGDQLNFANAFLEEIFSPELVRSSAKRPMWNPMEKSLEYRCDLAKYVLETDPYVDIIIRHAQNLAAEGLFEAYASAAKNSLRVRQQAQAIYRQIWRAALASRDEPWDSQLPHQHIRPPKDIMAKKHGNDFDIVLLFAACLKRVNLHPLIIILGNESQPTHAIAGYWLTADRFEDCVVGEQRLRAAADRIEFIAATSLLGERKDFDAALQKGREELQQNKIWYAVDVQAARQKGVQPEFI